MLVILCLTLFISALLRVSFSEDVRQQVRKIVALCYLWNWKRRNGLMFKFEEHTKDMAKSGYKSLPEAITRENPRTLTNDLNAIDSVGFQGTSNDGQALVVRIVRHHDRCSEVVVYMRLASGAEYQLPAHPDCLVYNTDGQTFSAGGLTLEVFEPLRCWRVSFNGTLERVNGNLEAESLVQVQFHFIWKPMSDYVGFPHDYKSKILADQMAMQHSNTTDLLKMLSKLVNYGERYEQFGVCHGTVSIGDDEAQTMLVRGIKQRTNGIQKLNSIKRKISINGVTKHGTSFHLFARRNVKMGQSLVYGYICASCNTVIRHVHQWSEKDLTQFGTKDQFSLSLKAGDRHYELEMVSEQKGVRIHCGEGNFKEDIRLIRFKLNGKEGYGFVESGHSSNGPNPYINRKSLPHLSDSNIKCTGRTVVTFKEDECRSSNIVGGKGSSLALMTSLRHSGWQCPIQFEVPQGVCITKLAFKRHVKNNPELQREIKTLERIAWKQTQGSIQMQCELLVRLVQNTVLLQVLKAQLKFALLEIFGHQFETQTFAVRSSAIGEDGEDLSSAGQNETFLGIKGLEEISSATIKCWASQFTTRAIEYKRQNGQLLNGGMAVVVQKMVAADVAGVLFTKHPVTGSRAHMLISSNYGLGESVVSGSADPDTILLKRNWNDELSVLKKQVGEKKLKITMSEKTYEADMNGTIESEVSSELASKMSVTDEMAIKLGQIAIYLEQSWGSARDIEWAINEKKIYILQSRPVTTESTLTDFEVQHEFDTVLKTDEETFSSANAGEILPGATTPLSCSTTFRSIAIQFKTTILWKNRRHHYDPTIVDGLLMAYNHAFFNRMLETFAGLDTEKSAFQKVIEIAIYGEVVNDDRILQQAWERADSPPFLALKKTALHTIKGMIFGKWMTRVNKIKFEHYPAMTRNATSIDEAYKAIEDKFMDIDKVMNLHIQISFASGLWNFLILSNLSQGNDPTMDLYRDFAMLTSGAIGTESGNAPHSLKELCMLIADDIEPQNFSNKAPEEALKWITEGQLPSSQKYKEFMKRHGHRGYKEYDVAFKTWSMEPKALVKILQEMVRNHASLRRSANDKFDTDLIDNLLTPLSPMKKKILRWANAGARSGVQRREQLKSLVIKIVDGARKGYRHLAHLMVAEGMLPDEDLLFYLTHEEIGILIKSRSAKLLRRAKQRQRMHSTMDKFKFPLIFSGIPQPITINHNQNETMLDGLTQVKGFPVCQGIVQGSARVIHSFNEVHTIKQGEILITQCTDIGWSPYFPMLAGIVTEIGGLVSHGAVVAREFGLPCIVGAQNATEIFKSGDTVLLNANKGILAKVAFKK